MPRCGPLALAVLLLAAGCGGSDEEVEASFAGTVPIGEGREVYVRCVGEGSPTVVFESGDESSSGQWDLVLPAVGERTTACAYDRLGVDRSSPAAGCRGMPELLDVVEAVLHELRVEPPIVMVGTSGGGYLAVGYALAHPADVAGLVLADTPRAIDPTKATPELLADLRCDSPGNQERRDYVAVEAAAWSARRPLDVPVTVISNDHGDAAFADPEQRANVEDQKGWLVLGSPAKQVVVSSGHDVPQLEPTLVADEVLAIVEQARSR